MFDIAFWVLDFFWWLTGFTPSWTVSRERVENKNLVVIAIIFLEYEWLIHKRWIVWRGRYVLGLTELNIFGSSCFYMTKSFNLHSLNLMSECRHLSFKKKSSVYLIKAIVFLCNEPKEKDIKKTIKTLNCHLQDKNLHLQEIKSIQIILLSVIKKVWQNRNIS